VLLYGLIGPVDNFHIINPDLDCAIRGSDLVEEGADRL